MQLIRKLGIILVGNWRISFGLFLCPFCLQEVERQLSNGKRQESCGCVTKELIGQSNFKHGQSNTRLYWVYANIKQRCTNPNNEDYKDYGGRGITVYPEWTEFIPFRDWALDNGYKDSLQIDRINNNGNYSPNNCRFVTSAENTQNRRTTKLNREKANEIRELYNIDKYTIKELTKIYNIALDTIYKIINNKIWKN